MPDQPGLDAVGGQGVLEGVTEALDVAAVDLGGLGPLEQGEGRQPPGARLGGRPEGDGELLGVAGAAAGAARGAGAGAGCPAGGDGSGRHRLPSPLASAADGSASAPGPGCVGDGGSVRPSASSRRLRSAIPLAHGLVGLPVVQAGPALGPIRARRGGGPTRPVARPAGRRGPPSGRRPRRPGPSRPARSAPAGRVPGRGARHDQQRQHRQGHQHHPGPPRRRSRPEAERRRRSRSARPRRADGR